jgi:hypothetical protein
MRFGDHVYLYLNWWQGAMQRCDWGEACEAFKPSTPSIEQEKQHARCEIFYQKGESQRKLGRFKNGWQRLFDGVKADRSGSV